MVPDTQTTNEVFFIGIGEYRVSDRALSTIGLGSCIGLVVHDKVLHIGGLAHIMLPDSNGRTDRPGKYADTAIRVLVEEISRRRGEAGNLTAKLVGGASMFVRFSESFLIGEKNIEAVRTQLKQQSIPIIAEDVGGKVGRTMTYYPYNGGKISIRRGDGSTLEI
jgi:chemotaxis protein CheD